MKTKPDYVGVDPKVQKYVDEYMWLSAQNNIHFDNKVSIGFTNIKNGAVVGYCNYGGWFREIDIDVNYWNNTTNSNRTALIYHELTHCYCGRSHDYSKDGKYPETVESRIARAIKWMADGGPRPGYYVDGCPTSLMYPVVVDSDCLRRHYSEYTSEMFDRCNAW